jgi:hypothetical protein
MNFLISLCFAVALVLRGIAGRRLRCAIYSAEGGRMLRPGGF